MMDWGGAVGGIVGGIFNYLGAREQADVARDIANQQLEAINRMRAEVYAELDPAKVNNSATEADTSRAINTLALQSLIDPSMSATRYASANNLLSMIMQPTGQAEQVADQLVGELAKDPKAEALKAQLIDAALDEIELGYSMPPDVQAELVKAGLEQAAGMGGGTAGVGSTRQGAAADLAKRLFGAGMLEIRNQRLDRASKLSESAAQLAAQRAQVLSNIFPNLKALQSESMKQQANAYQLGNSFLPEVGLSGTNIANVIMGRVGANQSLTGKESDILGNKGSALATAYSNLYGGLAGTASDVAGAIWGGGDKKEKK